MEAWESAVLSHPEVSPNTHRIDRQLTPRSYIIHTKKRINQMNVRANCYYPYAIKIWRFSEYGIIP
ncbi:hypothetical protein [uncultured Dysgonomonas sp.]|uniref:hypothetical protein n=1 Tax=uncultured Dysgonomonas sp. TaxID=206096 RepID=UPI0028042B88|nr:hypothetical protein [uncultured Dysgonomonas sp.]